MVVEIKLREVRPFQQLYRLCETKIYYTMRESCKGGGWRRLFLISRRCYRGGSVAVTSGSIFRSAEREKFIFYRAVVRSAE